MDNVMSKEIQEKPERSTFVNVLAWVFIVLGGFATFISILQNIMIQMFFPKEEISQAMQQSEQTENVPFFAQFMFNSIDLFFLLFLILSTISLISAIALLKRKNWARIIFIILMSLGIGWNILGLILQFIMFSSMPEMAGGDVPHEFANMMQIMKIASVIMVIGFSALFGFVIKKLCSKQIKEEFA